MSVASRTSSTIPAPRALGAAALGSALLLTLGVLLAYGPLAAAKPHAATAGPTVGVFDHGWSTAADRPAIDSGHHGAKTPLGVQHATGPGAPAGIVVKGAHGGGIIFTGIPSPAPVVSRPSDPTGNGGSTRIRLAR